MSPTVPITIMFFPIVVAMVLVAVDVFVQDGILGMTEWFRVPGGRSRYQHRQSSEASPEVRGMIFCCFLEVNADPECVRLLREADDAMRGVPIDTRLFISPCPMAYRVARLLRWARKPFVAKVSRLD